MNDPSASGDDDGDASSGEVDGSAEARGIFFVHPGDGPRFVPCGPGARSWGAIPRCAIPLAGRAVSWEHAELRFDGQTAVMRDLQSTNGVLVDGAPVSEALIEDGRVIRLGDFLGVAGMRADGGRRRARVARRPTAWACTSARCCGRRCSRC